MSSQPTTKQRAASLQTHFSRLAPSPLTTHLTDTNSIPILSTHPEPTSPGLSSLSSAFVQAHDTASRMGLGQPLRVTLSTSSGAAVIQTGIIAEGCDRDGGGGAGGEHEYRAVSRGSGGSGGAGDMLVGTVIAPGDRLAEARMASWGVEDVARRFQKSAHGGGGGGGGGEGQ